MTFEDDDSETREAEEEVLAWLRHRRASRLVYALLETGGTDESLAAFLDHGLVHPALEPRQLYQAQQVLVALCRALLTGQEQGHLSAASLAFERSFSSPIQADDDDEPTRAIRPAEPKTLFRKTSPQTPDSRRGAAAAGTTTPGTLRGFPPPLEPPTASDPGSPPIAEDEDSASQAPEDINTTGGIDVARLMAGFSNGDTAGLPFRPPSNKAAPLAPTAQRPPVAQASHPAAGATEGMDEADIAAAIASANAANPKRRSLPIPVEHYAALVVQSQQAGSMDRLERIHTAFKIESHAHRSEIDRAFTEALANDETLRPYFSPPHDGYVNRR